VPLTKPFDPKNLGLEPETKASRKVRLRCFVGTLDG
jgi:hypothetical protein